MPSVLLDHDVIAYGIIGAVLMATSDLSDAHLIVLGLLRGKNGLARVSPPWYDTVLRVVAPWLLGMAFFTAQLSEADADGGTIAMFAVSLVVLVAGHAAFEIAAGQHETARGASGPVRYKELYDGAVLLYSARRGA